MQDEQDGLSLSTSPFPNELSHQDSQSLPGSQLPDRNVNIYTEIPEPNAYILFGRHDHSNSHVDYALSPLNDTLADTGTYNALYSQPARHIIENSPAQVVNDVNPMANGLSDHVDISYTSTNDSQSGLTFPYAHPSSQQLNSGFPSHFDGNIGQSFSHQQSSIRLNPFQSDNIMTRSTVENPREPAPPDTSLHSRVSHLTLPQQLPEKGHKVAHGASHGKPSGTDQIREYKARKDRDSARKGKDHAKQQTFRIAKRRPSKKPALKGKQYPHHGTVAACSLWLSLNSGKMPSEHEMFGLSLGFGSSVEFIRNWFRQNVTVSIEDEDTGYQTMRASTTDIASLYRGNRGCERKATSIGVRAVTSRQIPRNESRPFACTSRCPKSFKKKAGWERHEEKNRVQRLWICDFQGCRNKEGRKRVWLNRKEHFLKHLSSHHPGLDTSSRDIENCYVEMKSNFDKHCIFSSCDHIFQSWKERINHIGKHFQRPWKMSEWRDMDEEEKDTDATDVREDESGDSESDDPDDESASDDTEDGASGHGPSKSSHDRGADRHGGHPGSSAQRPGSNGHHSGSRDGASTAFFQYNWRTYGCQDVPPVPDISIRSVRERFLKSRNLFSGSSQARSRLPTRNQTATRPFVAAQSMRIYPLRVLGRGSFAIVDEVKMQGCEKTFARKQMLSRTRDQKRSIHREGIIMARLKHPHVINFVASYQQMNSINYLIRPVADCNLLEYMTGQYSGPDYRSETEGWFSCLASGLQYLHNCGVRHRDIKPSNIILSQSRILYTDFGSSNMISDDDSSDSESADFTERYAAPEVFRGHRGRAADVFALGCVYYEMVAFLLQDPWRHERERTYHSNPLLSDAREQHMPRRSTNRGKAGSMPPSGPDMSIVEAQCKAMTEPKPEQRPTAAEIARRIPARVCCEGLDIITRSNAESELQSNEARQRCEYQTRIEAFERDTEDRLHQRLAEGWSRPVGKQERAGVIHGPHAPSLHTTNRSEAGGSIRVSSVAPSTSVGSSEAPGPYSSDVVGSCPRYSRPRYRCHVSNYETRSNCSDKTINGTKPLLISSFSSCISDLSVLDSMGKRALDKSIQLPEEGCTVRTSYSQQTPYLECPWSPITRCKKVFPVSDSEKWVAHTKKVHLSKEGRRGLRYVGPPTLNFCGLCDAKFYDDNRELSWSNLMDHLKQHHIIGHHLAHARIDWSLVEYLWEKGLLTRAEYRELKPIRNAQDIPSPPGLSDDEDPITLVEERRYQERR